MFIFDSGIDTITDFSLLTDRIVLDGAALGIEGLSGADVVGISTQIVFYGATGSCLRM